MASTRMDIQLWQQAAQAAANTDNALWTRQMQDTLLIAGGGSGRVAGMRALSLFVPRGQVPAWASFDNASSAPADILLPDGQRLEWKQIADGHYYLNVGNRRTALRRHPVLVARYEGAHGLLRGLTVASTHEHGGDGGSAIPLLSQIDLDLEIAEVRRHLRGALQRAFRQERRNAGRLSMLAGSGPQEQRQPFVLVLAGGAGSCGAALTPWMGYLVRAEAAQMGLPPPRVWLLLAGPSSYQGLTPWTLTNWAATLQGLQHLARHGIKREWIDGTVFDEATPPYELTLCIDDAQIPADGRRVSEVELDGFLWWVAVAARALLDPAIRAAYLEQAVNFQQDGAGEWPSFGTVQVANGGFDAGLLRTLVAGELAGRRAQALAGLLGAAA